MSSTPFIDFKRVWEASPNHWCSMRSGSSADGGHGQFMLGYLCAIAFRLGMTADDIRAVYAAARSNSRGKHVTNWDYAHALHAVVEERIASLPTA